MTKVDSIMQQLRQINILQDRIRFVNGLGVWSCYDLYLGYHWELEDCGLVYYVLYNLFRLFLKGNIDIKLYRYEWHFVNKLYNTAIYDMLDQI